MTYNSATKWIRYSVTLRVALIGMLALLLLIPVGMVKMMIDERDWTRESAITEIGNKWGTSQTIAGPILSIPYTTYQVNDKGQRVMLKQYAHFLPEELNITGTIDPETRSRGIFESVVYTSDLTLDGTFQRPDLVSLGINESDVLWNDAFMSVGIPDMRGIDSEIMLTWNGDNYSFDPGIPTDDVVRNVFGMHLLSQQYDKGRYDIYSEPTVLSAGTSNDSSGVSIKVPVLTQYSDNRLHTFKISLSLNGSESLNILPVGRSTIVDIQSPWNAPSFDGAFLPDEREVTDEGFAATWEILDLNRNYPQSWTGNKYNVYASSFGVNLLVTVDEYTKSSRSAKYALLIIALTFMIFFFVEIFNKKRVHPIQYLLVGLALVLFYSLLVSLSELLGFDWAYLISSIATIGLIVLYSRAILPSSKMVSFQGLILAFLYLFVYSILQLEDYALLAGSIGLFVILSTVMYLSRKVDWYAIGETDMKE